MLAAGGEKAKIGNGQRGMEVAEKAEGRRWEPRFIGRLERDGVLERLGIKDGLGEEKGGGDWRWDGEKARMVLRLFHDDL